MTQRKGDPRVSVEVEGRQLPLRFNMGAVHDLMEATSLNLLQGLSPEDGQDPRTMMALLWSLAGGPDSGYESPRALSRVVDVADLGSIAEAVGEAISKARPLA